MSTAIAPGTSRLLSDQVFDKIKREIIECRLEPESVIAEGTLADRYGVSKGPVREALKRLAQIGLVRALPRVGYIVSGVNLRDFDEIFMLRIALEPLAAELATPRLSDQELEELAKLARVSIDFVNAPFETRGRRLASANAEFHRRIAAASGNRRLEETISRLLDDVERVIFLLAYDPVHEDLLNQHQSLVAVLSTRDGKAAAERMRVQLIEDFEAMRALAVGGSRTSPLSFGVASATDRVAP